jgi:hypothetical protein
MTEEEEEEAEAAREARKTLNGTPFDLVPVHLSNASTLGYGLGRARPGNWIEYSMEGKSECGVVLGRINRGDGAGRLVVLAFGLVSGRTGMERWVAPEDVLECHKGPSLEYLHLIALLSQESFVREHGARLLRDARDGYVSESSVDERWRGMPDDERRSFYKQKLTAPAMPSQGKED